MMSGRVSSRGGECARAGVGGGRVRLGLSAVLEMSSSRGVSRREKSDRRPPWIRSPREVALESAPHATSDGSAARYCRPRCRQCNTALGLEPRSPAEGRHWARECRPKAVTGPALGTGVPAEGRHWPALGTGVPAEGRHWARECRPKAVST